jgi:hypothetical protein
MKHTSHLRSGLHNGLLLAAPLTLATQCDSREHETGVTELTVEIEPAEFVQELNECLMDQEACVALCDRILVEQGYTEYPGEAEIHRCTVTKKAASVEVSISYSPYPMAVGCGVVTVEPASTPTSIGSHYAALAELEGASVYAFARLARDLRRHDASSRLVHAAVRAVGDEARHTRMASMLAYAWGATPRPPRSHSHTDRDLFALCLDNAVDGCVHETFGASIAAHQARTAKDPFIRSIMESIARDERRHAALAEAIDRWARPRLRHDQREAVEMAARDAAHVLASSQKDAPHEVSELAGFPSAVEAQALVEALEAVRRARWS